MKNDGTKHKLVGKDGLYRLVIVSNGEKGRDPDEILHFSELQKIDVKAKPDKKKQKMFELNFTKARMGGYEHITNFWESKL